MLSHEIDYEIIGAGSQLVELSLDPGERVIGNPGAMTYYDNDVTMTARIGDKSGSRNMFSKVLSLFKKVVTSSSVAMVHFENKSESIKHVGFSAPSPGQIIALDLNDYPTGIMTQKSAFLSAAFGTRVDSAIITRLAGGFFAGEGFVLQRVWGDGVAFISAGGSIIKKQLKDDTIKIETGSLVAFSEGMTYNIEATGGARTIVLGGEGAFTTVLSGTGDVFIQSLPFSRLATEVMRAGEKKRKPKIT